MASSGGAVLVVEDEPAQRALLSSMLRRASLESELVEDMEAALGAMAERRFGAVLSDIRMPGRSGIELVKEARRVAPGTPVVVMTGFPTLESAVESIRAGAFDYIQKPFRRDELIKVLRRALERPPAHSRRRPEESRPHRPLLGESAPMQRARGMIERLAKRSTTVLLRGESGTGKEVAARSLHATSGRRGPFLAINCAAIPEGLLESELFGHTRGAFTGAAEPKKGLLEQTHGGTVLLDEIGDMPLALQPKLLRFLEERELRPVGGGPLRSVDVRVIAATHTNLELEVENGRFRRDLYYRLHVVPLYLPPLRQHPEDIPELVEHILGQLPDEPTVQLSRAAQARLTEMSWPGNVRELENVLEHAAVVCENGRIELSDLRLIEADAARLLAQDDSLIRRLAQRKLSLEEVEERLIQETLAMTGGNTARTAEILGVSRRTLQRRRAAGEEESSAPLEDSAFG